MLDDACPPRIDPTAVANPAEVLGRRPPGPTGPRRGGVRTRTHEARVAGALYLLLGVTSAFGMSVPSAFMVGRDAVATVARIEAAQLLYRLGLVSTLASQIVFVFLVLALYRLLRGVDERQAALMVALVLVQVPMVFANVLCASAPLILSSWADAWPAFDEGQRAAVAMLFLRLHRYGEHAVMALWGLWLLPFGILVHRSGFLPRVLGVLLVVGCLGWLVICLTFLLFPSYAHIADRLAVLAIGEVLTILWLVTRGADSGPGDQPSSQV